MRGWGVNCYLGNAQIEWRLVERCFPKDDDANVMRLTASEVEWERIEGEKAREMEKLEEKGDVFSFLELDKTTFWSGLESTPCP